MEGKVVRATRSTVFMVVFILGLVLAQTHVEAKSCCINTTARNCYNTCRVTGASQATCASLCGCKHITGTTCPSDYPKHFCKLGCASSMCSTISIPQKSDVGEEAMIGCENTCSELCNKGYKGSNEGYESFNEFFTA